MTLKKTIANHLLFPEVCRMVAAGIHVKIRVKGNSMIPFLFGQRDEVILSPFCDDDLVEGRIVLAFLPTENRYVLHRIVYRDGCLLTLMGDGNVKGYEVCTTDDICAQVRKAIRNGKETDFTTPGWIRYARWWRRSLAIRRYLLWGVRTFDEPAYLVKGIKRKIKLI